MRKSSARMEVFMKQLELNNRKVAVIGCGFVGATSAFGLMQSGLFSEMVLIDANTEKAEGEAMDISHGIPFARPMKIYAGGYDDIMDAAIIVVTAGANQKPGETRLDLVQKNVGIFKSIIPEIAKRDYQGILLIVSNPVDILTYTAHKLSGMPENRVIGSGTVLDTARLKGQGRPAGCAGHGLRGHRARRAEPYLSLPAPDRHHGSFQDPHDVQRAQSRHLDPADDLALAFEHRLVRHLAAPVHGR